MDAVPRVEAAITGAVAATPRQPKTRRFALDVLIAFFPAVVLATAWSGLVEWAN
jgi:hypothetical protein